MIRDTAAGLRYGRSWLTGKADVTVREVEVDRGDRRVPATLFLPRETGRRRLPGWILLHGVTVPGRVHPQLVRFARALAHRRAAVLVPEVPEWTALRLAPAFTAPTVDAALKAMAAAAPAVDRPVGLMGFSFGGPHAIAAAARPELRERLAGVAAFGGYCDLARTLRFLLLGRHEWRGRRFQDRPDPYGRWIVGGNYLSRTPGYEGARDVADALLALATEAGRRGVPSWDPEYEPLRRKLADRFRAERRDLFETFAPPPGEHPPKAVADGLVEAMAPAIRRVDPLMDPTEALAEVGLPVRLLHGRHDPLIPFTETLRMSERLPSDVDSRATVTNLFAHSEESAASRGLERILESARFARALGDVLRMA